MSSRDALMAAIPRLMKLKDRNIYEDRLIDYAEYVWPVIEPAIPFIRGWAIESISDHLEAVTRGHIRKLLMNVPPGFTKSLFTDVFWPSWEWGPRNMPWLRYVCASYSNHLTERDNMRCRNIVISDRYRDLWGKRFGISNGWKLATSVGGIGVGERGDRFIIDDPNNTMDMESAQVRETTNMWFTEVVPDRLNNPQESAIVIIQQRLHEDDVSGVALARKMGFTHLLIPMEYEPRVYVNGYDADGKIKTYINEDVALVAPEDIFWEDPRIEDGELAWPERFTQEVCDDLKRDKGPYAWAGQYQQTPAPRGGAIIKEDFWQVWDQDKFPNFEYILASLDTAFTEKEENDPSAITIWGVFRDEAGNPKVMLMWAWEERLEFSDLFQKVVNTCVPSLSNNKMVPSFPVDKLIIESKASGMSVGQELHRLVRGRGEISIELIDPKRYGDKIARMHAVQHMFADNMVYAPNREYSDKVIRHCAIFPRGSHDDLADTVSQAMRYLRDCGFVVRRDEHSMASQEEMMYRSPRSVAPLYEC
jgi:predicted phage terminase large subunit-like protein